MPAAVPPKSVSPEPGQLPPSRVRRESLQTVEARSAVTTIVPSPPEGPPLRGTYSQMEVLKLWATFCAVDASGDGICDMRELSTYMMREAAVKNHAQKQAHWAQKAEAMQREEDALNGGVREVRASVRRGRSAVGHESSSGAAATRSSVVRRSSSAVDLASAGIPQIFDATSRAAAMLRRVDSNQSGGLDFGEYLQLGYPKAPAAERKIIWDWVVNITAAKAAKGRGGPVHAAAHDTRGPSGSLPRERLSAEQLEDLELSFENCNASGSGRLTREELLAALLEAGYGDEAAAEAAREAFTLHAVPGEGGEEVIRLDGYIDFMAKPLLLKVDLPPEFTRGRIGVRVKA